jgi:hypothetical protein
MRVTVFRCWGALYVRFQSIGLPVYAEGIAAGPKQMLWNMVCWALERKVPHNVVIYDDKTVFLILRGFATEGHPLGYLEYSGLVTTKSEE